MPYIRLPERLLLDDTVNELIPKIVTPGQLNYVITKLLIGLHPHPRYTDFVLMLGTLEAVKAELYRRVVAPYEDTKCKENGDAYNG